MSKVTKSELVVSEANDASNEKTKRRSKGVKVGDYCLLNIDTPYGLYETHEGDWYLVTHNGEWKLAIVLVHSDLPSFTCLMLKPVTLAGGRWWGAFHVSASLPICDEESSEVGLLSDGGENTVSLRCHTPLVYTQWVDVGHVMARREEYDKSEPNDLGPDYSSWTIARAHDDLPIVSRSADGTLEPGGPEADADDYVSHMRVRPYRI